MQYFIAIAACIVMIILFCILPMSLNDRILTIVGFIIVIIVLFAAYLYTECSVKSSGVDLDKHENERLSVNLVKPGSEQTNVGK